MEEEIIFKIEVPGAPQSITTIENLTKANKALREERKKLNLDSAEGIQRAKEINQAIDNNTEIIKKNSSALEKQRLNVGNYKQDIVEAAKETQVMGVSVSTLTEKFGGMSVGLLAAGGVIAGLGALAKGYLSSAAGARDLASAQTQLQTSFTFISNEIARLAGADGKGGGLLSFLASEFNRVLFGLDATVRGTIAANVQNTLQEIEIVELEAQRFAKNQLDLAEEQRRIRDDETKSYRDRFEAANQVQTFIDAREEKLLEVQRTKLKQLQLLLALDKDNLDLQKQVKQVEFEISDIQEDSQGKRTEALNGIKVLQKEVNDQEKEFAEWRKNVELQLLEEEKLILQERLDNYKFFLSSKNEALTRYIEEQQQITQAQSEIEKIANELEESEEDQAILRKAEKETELAAKRVEKRKEVADKTKELQKQELAQATNLFGQLSALSAKESGEQKAFALTSIALNSAQGVAAATKAGAGVPFPGNLAAIIAGISSVLAGIAQAKSLLGFFDGGIVGYAGGGLSGTRIMPYHGRPIRRSNGDNLLATVKTGEVILNQSQQARLGGSSTFRAIGVPGFASGGSTSELPLSFSGISRQTESASLSREIFKAISQIKPVVTVEDINLGQERVDVIESRAQVL